MRTFVSGLIAAVIATGTVLAGGLVFDQAQADEQTSYEGWNGYPCPLSPTETEPDCPTEQDAYIHTLINEIDRLENENSDLRFKIVDLEGMLYNAQGEAQSNANEAAHWRAEYDAEVNAHTETQLFLMGRMTKIQELRAKVHRWRFMYYHPWVWMGNPVG